MDNGATIQSILEVMQRQEALICRQSATTISLYTRERNYILSMPAEEWASSMGLLAEHGATVLNFMLSSSFAAAWYQLAGDNRSREKVAQCFAILTSSLGVKTEVAFLQHVSLEARWGDFFLQQKITATNGRGIRWLLLSPVDLLWRAIADWLATPFCSIGSTSSQVPKVSNMAADFEAFMMADSLSLNTP